MDPLKSEAFMREELVRAGGCMHWRELCSAVATRLGAEGQQCAEEKTQAHTHILAIIPYMCLSEQDGLVRLPLPTTTISASLSRWAGWKLGVDEALEEAGGVMPWRRLRDSVVARYCLLSGSCDVDLKSLGRFVLAHVPKEYVSRRSVWVKLPAIPEWGELWPGRRLEVSYMVQEEVVLHAGWVTEQVGPQHVVVVFDAGWSVDLVKLPKTWRDLTPELAMKSPTRRVRVLPGLGTRDTANRKYTGEDDVLLLEWVPQISDRCHHWRWIDCAFGVFRPIPTSNSSTSASSARYSRLISLQSLAQERLPSGVTKEKVIHTMRRIGSSAATKDICQNFQHLYADCCSDNILLGSRCMKVWQKDVQHVLSNNKKLFVAEGSTNRLQVWSLSGAVHTALAEGTLQKLLKPGRRPVAGPKQVSLSRRGGVRQRLNKVRAVGAWAGR
ncbi:unnamed protein product [Polarella glacialis]|uniref:Uncharacterized protein n=1 Tax=Polarella glacialis TaxID=89957 RepID=A0A813H121_POLGL|nr:unnamed protein product [Polarella glacialis]